MTAHTLARRAWSAAVWAPVLALTLALQLAGGARAQAPAANAIESITANQQGANVIVRIALRNAPVAQPISFAITNPARIALDFGATINATDKNVLEFNQGDLRGVNLVQAGERSRLVFNLKRTLNYATAIDGNAVILTIDGSGGLATAVDGNGLPAARSAPAPAGKQLLRDLDFRRGANGEGRVVVDLPNNQVAVDVRQTPTGVMVDFLKTGVPENLRRRLDVGDFGTPVSLVTTVPQGENTRLIIEARGLWEQTVYQSDTQLVVDVKPIKEDPNKLTQGSQGYRGEKLSFNFQNVEVRAALQAIADISGLNIITSDSVAGNLTLRLREVPWDQALDVILQAKGLDMRKNGSVIWIAPKEELLTKEKLELEQRAQIADLEPLKSEIFQLNYQKAEAFKTVFGLEGGDAKARILSKRGSAIIEPRTNQLFVTDIASKLEDVRRLIAKTDIATKQVLIEARIVEASDTFTRNLGAKLGFSDMRTIRGGDSGYQIGNGNTRFAIGGNLTGVGQTTGQVAVTDTSFNNTQFINLPAGNINGAQAGSLAISLFSSAANRFLNLELSALEEDGTGKIISSPRVITADKAVALIEQGIELPYQVATSSGATSIQFRKANLRLEVTPQITPDGNVVIDVDVNKDSVGQETRSGFAIDTKHVKTQVMVDNGGTVVLGGIYQQTERSTTDKVPLLGDIPVLGYLFRSNSRTNDKTELLVFITPKIVTERLSTAR
ncbi:MULTISPECIES: type IV pilus secretin PilQ [unclassified Duganella]|uniref:type IV pilus secretin PilQ n=1 Tax=unclassified Duganella TaxID=2636909 RepID=UPI000889DB90|nr:MULTISPECIES: type IV pilus secretin PilQ [unclassified Duganella]SDH61974.1 type IV pilus assembly protein PilQ [Duganella sp. OV458]SDJ40920.1 type IV pilus assembly protein PilQ [Duganella sp. OV510]